MTIEQVAHRMFIRNVADYADPTLAELAWIDPDIRTFWVQQAEAVVTDLTELTGEDSDAATRRRHGAGPTRYPHSIHRRTSSDPRRQDQRR